MGGRKKTFQQGARAARFFSQSSKYHAKHVKAKQKEQARQVSQSSSNSFSKQLEDKVSLLSLFMTEEGKIKNRKSTEAFLNSVSKMFKTGAMRGVSRNELVNIARKGTVGPHHIFEPKKRGQVHLEVPEHVIENNSHHICSYALGLDSDALSHAYSYTTLRLHHHHPSYILVNALPILTMSPAKIGLVNPGIFYAFDQSQFNTRESEEPTPRLARDTLPYVLDTNEIISVTGFNGSNDDFRLTTDDIFGVIHLSYARKFAGRCANHFDYVQAIKLTQQFHPYPFSIDATYPSARWQTTEEIASMNENGRNMGIIPDGQRFLSVEEAGHAVTQMKDMFPRDCLFSRPMPFEQVRQHSVLSDVNSQSDVTEYLIENHKEKAAQIEKNAEISNPFTFNL